MKRAPDQATLLRLILGAIGLGSLTAATIAGCGSSVVVESSGNAGSGGGTTSSSGSGGTAGTGATTGTGGGGVCTAPTSTKDVDVPTSGPCSTFYHASYVCFPPPKPPASCDSVYSQACVLAAYSCGLQSVGDAECGPDPTAPNACCYTVVGDCPVGRPFLVHGRARLGTLVLTDRWADRVAPDMASLDPQTCAALADFWAREALSEHASIASFARFTLQLLATGAPADLLRGAQQALADEIDHATLCFGLASSYSGTQVGPSALDPTGALEGCQSPLDIAVALAREGCIAETVSALLVAAARDAAADPVLRAALGKVAEQEMEHAALAWRSLKWALDRGDASLHAAVTAVFETPEPHVGIGTLPALPGDPAAMREHGCLPPEERRALAADTLARVVMPAARSLLASTRPADPARETPRPFMAL